MKKLLFAALAVLALFSTPASAAQTQVAALVLSACGTLPSGVTYAAGTYGIVTMDTTGKLCDGSSSASGGLPVVNGASTYNTVAASQTTQALTGGGGGATGDYLSHVVVVPASTSPGVVTIFDNSTAIYSFPGGASSLSNLVPFTIPVGAVSTNGAWKITTGANLSVVAVGKFH